MGVMERTVSDIDSNVCLAMDMESDWTPIQKFYAGQSILITGGTGFLGKILIEKLLWSCPDISTIYLLIRPKKNKNPESRLNDIFKTPIYDRIKKKVPNFRNKIVLVTGDLEAEGLGLSEDDINLLIHNVTIVFHMAATVRFNEEFKTATAINVGATNYILNISKRMSNLKSFIHVSTFYANCHIKHIEERFYEYPFNHKNFIALMSTLPENTADERIARITSQWPNSYTCTKAVAEALLRDESEDLPIGIFRPAIVTSSAHEPLAGWIDNLYGPIGITVSALLGFTRVQLCMTELTANFVPVDNTINALIVSAWDVSNHPSRRGKDMLIYNFVSSNDAPLTWGEYISNLNTLHRTFPLSNSIWLPVSIIVRRKILYTICIWFSHLLPALFIDVARMTIGLKPRIWKFYKQIHKAYDAISYFSLNNWSCTNDNVQMMWSCLNEKDQQLFKFNMKGFDWSEYFLAYYMGMRTYLLNEDDKMLEISRIRLKRLYWIHQIFKSVLIFTILWLAWKIFMKIFL